MDIAVAVLVQLLVVAGIAAAATRWRAHVWPAVVASMLTVMTTLGGMLAVVTGSILFALNLFALTAALGAAASVRWTSLGGAACAAGAILPIIALVWAATVGTSYRQVVAMSVDPSQRATVTTSADAPDSLVASIVVGIAAAGFVVWTRRRLAATLPAGQDPT
jgi:hypothetical protein